MEDALGLRGETAPKAMWSDSTCGELRERMPLRSDVSAYRGGHGRPDVGRRNGTQVPRRRKEDAMEIRTNVHSGNAPGSDTAALFQHHPRARARGVDAVVPVPGRPGRRSGARVSPWLPGPPPQRAWQLARFRRVAHSSGPGSAPSHVSAGRRDEMEHLAVRAFLPSALVDEVALAPFHVGWYPVRHA